MESNANEDGLDAFGGGEIDLNHPLYRLTATTAAKDFLSSLGISPTQGALRQLSVFARCMMIFSERNARYGELWASRGYMGSLFHMDSKMARVWQRFWVDKVKPLPEQFDAESDLDDMYDLINYSTFFIRNAQTGNERGVK